MNRLETWLDKEAMGWQAVRLTILCFIFNFIYSLTAILLIDYLVGMPDVLFERTSKLANPSITDFFIVLVIIGPVMEELIFRFIPLYIILSPRSKDFNGVIIMATAASVIFGYLHGGIAHIFIQGVGGFLLCLLFLKCGGYHRRYFKGFCASFSAHALLNLTVAGVILILRAN